ncbi:MAG: DUF2652 domain-containing protein [Chitinophagaceae bacterium]
MAENNATILIPDISGFTEFMTTTELNHSSHAINILIDAMLKAIGDEYEVAEIEGDAVLLIKKGPAPSKKEIEEICLKIFNAFHFQRKWMQQYTICPCGACQAIINLTLKFVAHHGPLAEITIGKFVKHSGPEMIVAHRLLKNSINNNEYLLMTEKLLSQSTDITGIADMEWISSSDEYASIGKVDYRFALLNDIRRTIPEPPPPPKYNNSDTTIFAETILPANGIDAHLALTNFPGRNEWLPGLIKTEQDFPTAFIGSVHRCIFNDYTAVVSPLRMSVTDEGIMYAESCRYEDLDLSIVNEFVFKKISTSTCTVAARFTNTSEIILSEAINTILLRRLRLIVESLKVFLEKSR